MSSSTAPVSASRESQSSTRPKPTSALPPMPAMVEKPTPFGAAQSSTTRQRAADCDTRASRPGGGAIWARERLSFHFRHHHAEGAGAEGADAGGARCLPDAIGHAGHRHAARAERGQGLEHRQHRPVERSQHGEVGRGRKFRHGFHRLQRAFEAALFQVGAQLPAGGRTGAEDGDGARAEHLLRPEFTPSRGAILGHGRTLHHATGLHAALPRR